VDTAQHVHLQDIHIGMDLGDKLVIDQGLKPTDTVIDNPPDSLRDGDSVKLADAGAPHVAKT
jgi:hypothetical protein